MKVRLICGILICGILAGLLAKPTYALQYGKKPVGKPAIDSKLSAEFDSLLVMDRTTQTVLFENASDATFSPTGIAVHLMVAYVIAGNADLEQEIPIIDAVNDISADARKLGLVPGKRWVIRDLVAAMLLYGAQDAALVLSNHVREGQAEFVALMNQTASQLGMAATLYDSPLGAYHTVQTTTAADLALLLHAVQENDVLRDMLALGTYDAIDGTSIKSRVSMMDSASSVYDNRIKGIGAGSATYAGTNLLLEMVDGEDDFLLIGHAKEVNLKRCEESALALLGALSEAYVLLNSKPVIDALLESEQPATPEALLWKAQEDVNYNFYAEKSVAAQMQAGATGFKLVDLVQSNQDPSGAISATAVLQFNGDTVCDVRLTAATPVIEPTPGQTPVSPENSTAPDETAVNPQTGIPTYAADDWGGNAPPVTLFEKYGCWIIIGAATIVSALVIASVKIATRKKR